jgi:hypothetical protein
MFIYLLTCNLGGYDSFNGHIVIAESEEEARSFCRCGDECKEKYRSGYNENHDCVWRDPNQSTCEKIGTAEYNQDKGVVLSSFNAG